MIAVDTNVLVRFLVRDDDPGQSDRASPLFADGPVFVACTVLLETVRVLRAVFGFSQPEIVRAMRLLGGLPCVRLEDSALLSAASELRDGGLDLPDALHLAATPGRAGFATFDRALARRAARLPTAPRVRLL